MRGLSARDSLRFRSLWPAPLEVNRKFEVSGAEGCVRGSRGSRPKAERREA